MTAFAPTAALGSFELDRSTHTVRFNRIISASAKDVFNAWTKPEEVRAWWDPGGHPLALCEIDLQPGGKFTFVNTGHSAQPFEGTYVEISPPTRLTFEVLGATGRVMLKQMEAGTHMVVEISCTSEEHLEQFVRIGVAAGTAKTLDNLVSFTEGKAS
jgi:uncharacterized protein YndB with AHSA1/START domain